MRLTCPNCEAQYEVPDEVVPVEGRDVQCSNCGETWYQHHADHLPEEDEDIAIEPDASEPDVPEPDLPEPDMPDPDLPEPDMTEPEEEQEEEASPPPLPVTERPEPERKQLDPAVADILRQEAEVENKARRQRQSDPIETQPDLGLETSDKGDEVERRAQEARQRMARMRGEPEPISDAEAKAVASSPRRDLLPDIEEINSTLRNDDARVASEEGYAHLDGPTTKKRKRSFRRGLLIMFVLFVIAALIYVFARQIAEAAPQLDAALTSYVVWVDNMRLWLDGQVQAAASWLDTMASQSGN